MKFKNLFNQNFGFFLKTSLTNKQIKNLMYHDRIWMKCATQVVSQSVTNILYRFLTDRGYCFNYDTDIKKYYWLKHDAEAN